MLSLGYYNTPNVIHFMHKTKTRDKKISYIEAMKRYSIFLDEKDVKKLREIAEEKGLSWSTLARMILKEYLKGK